MKRLVIEVVSVFGHKYVHVKEQTHLQSSFGVIGHKYVHASGQVHLQYELGVSEKANDEFL